MNIVEIVTHVKRMNPINDRRVFDALALCGEAGEVANIVKKTEFYPDYGARDKQIIDELSDVLFHLVSLCQEMGISLDELSMYCVKKQSERWCSGENE